MDRKEVRMIECGDASRDTPERKRVSSEAEIGLHELNQKELEFAEGTLENGKPVEAAAHFDEISDASKRSARGRRLRARIGSAIADLDWMEAAQKAMRAHVGQVTTETSPGGEVVFRRPQCGQIYLSRSRCIAERQMEAAGITVLPFRISGAEVGDS